MQTQLRPVASDQGVYCLRKFQTKIFKNFKMSKTSLKWWMDSNLLMTFLSRLGIAETRCKSGVATYVIARVSKLQIWKLFWGLGLAGLRGNSGWLVVLDLTAL